MRTLVLFYMIITGILFAKTELITYLPSEVHEKYTANELRAQRVFDETNFLVKGKVKDIIVEYGTVSVIIKDPTFEEDNIICKFKESKEIDKIVYLDKGDAIVLKGSLNKNHYDVILEDSSFVEVISANTHEGVYYYKNGNVGGKINYKTRNAKMYYEDETLAYELTFGEDEKIKVNVYYPTGSPAVYTDGNNIIGYNEKGNIEIKINKEAQTGEVYDKNNTLIYTSKKELEKYYDTDGNEINDLNIIDIKKKKVEEILKKYMSMLINNMDENIENIYASW